MAETLRRAGARSSQKAGVQETVASGGTAKAVFRELQGLLRTKALEATTLSFLEAFGADEKGRGFVPSSVSRIGLSAFLPGQEGGLSSRRSTSGLTIGTRKLPAVRNAVNSICVAKTPYPRSFSSTRSPIAVKIRAMGTHTAFGEEAANAVSTVRRTKTAAANSSVEEGAMAHETA